MEPLDVHGYGAIIVMQAAWQIWIGILLCREPRDRRQVVSPSQ